MDNEELKKEIFDEDRLKHSEQMIFMTKDWILFDILDVHDSNAGYIAERITYKQVLACFNWIMKNREKFRGIGIHIQHEYAHVLEEQCLL